MTKFKIMQYSSKESLVLTHNSNVLSIIYDIMPVNFYNDSLFYNKRLKNPM